jgi:hypothetical protein
MPDNPDAETYGMHSFGAQFAEVQVNRDTGEVRVPRMLGVSPALGETWSRASFRSTGADVMV